MKKRQRTQRQHFVPQGYLKLFSLDGKSIWVYDKKTRRISVQNIRDTGFQKNFYSSRIHTNPLDIPLVSDLEGKAQVIIKTMESRNLVTPKDLGTLLNFIALLLLRTPSTKKKLISTFQLFWQELRRRYRYSESDSSTFSKKAENIAESFIEEQEIKNITPKEFLEQEIDINYPAEDFPRSIVACGFKIAQLLSEQKWEFLFALGGNNFLTSDNPFSIFPKEEKPYFPAITSDVTKLLPLSKRFCVTFTNGNNKFQKKEMLPWAVRVINLGIASRAERFIYSPNKELLEDVDKNLSYFEKIPAIFVPANS